MMKTNTPKRTAALALSLLTAGFLPATSAHAACNPYAPQTTPSAAFEVHGDGTVTHLSTGLMWKVCSEGQGWAADGSCSGTASSHTWQEALQLVQTLNAGGGFATHTDWRLPNLKELKSIVEHACSSPAINDTIFNNTPSSYYWSSSPNAAYSTSAWGVDFGYGSASSGDRTSILHARLVRGGQ